MNRRTLLRSLPCFLAAPAIVRAQRIMPVRVWQPWETIGSFPAGDDYIDVQTDAAAWARANIEMMTYGTAVFPPTRAVNRRTGRVLLSDNDMRGNYFAFDPRSMEKVC